MALFYYQDQNACQNTFLFKVVFSLGNSWFATTWQGGHVGGQYNTILFRRNCMKIEFSSQRRETVLFLTTNMAAVTSRANQQYNTSAAAVNKHKNTHNKTNTQSHNFWNQHSLGFSRPAPDFRRKNEYSKHNWQTNLFILEIQISSLNSL